MTGNFCENAYVKGILFSEPETHVKVRRITFFVIVQCPKLHFIVSPCILMH
jgi:hypothetical protein